MRRFTLAAMLACLLSATAVALPTKNAGEYNGHVRGDPYPESAIWFDIDRTEAGRRRVVDFSASGLDYRCESGPPGETPAVFLQRGFRIKRDRTFGGRADAVIAGFDPPARLRGKIRRRGRAVGTLRIHGELDPVGHPGVECTTGRLEWRARRGPRPES